MKARRGPSPSFLIALICLAVVAAYGYRHFFARSSYASAYRTAYLQSPAQKLDTSEEIAKLSPEQRHFLSRLADAAIERTRHDVVYDPKYVVIPYPGGDVPEGTGVCTDVVIRSYRALGVDLQRLVHEDMKKRFGQYPKIWGMKAPDSNIDHRRVPNLIKYFEKHGKKLPISQRGSDYRTGALVAWRLAGGATHIGIVTGKMSTDGKRPLVVHNIGAGPQLEDVLFEYEIIGHFLFVPRSLEKQ